MTLKPYLTATVLSLAAALVAMPQQSHAMPAVPLAVETPASLLTPVHGSIHWRKGHPYWNGHRGYRHRRPGYRHYGGYWFPHHAFSFGIIITPRPYEPTYQLTRAHYRWCEGRYRSYRRWDNSFQPYHGPRKPCVSPYLRRAR